MDEGIEGIGGVLGFILDATVYDYLVSAFNDGPVVRPAPTGMRAERGNEIFELKHKLGPDEDGRYC